MQHCSIFSDGLVYADDYRWQGVQTLGVWGCYVQDDALPTG